ncbi:MAG: glucosylglycerol-phosphate synthase [Rhodobacterales bacterium CG_4_10_14_0_8_um_filter_70_9]|nr:MAG: glucosylglycerol-phosphate synthase [Rhodobacterales bacterium CG_4_10_14_0_8_um_filter_70_9]
MPSDLVVVYHRQPYEQVLVDGVPTLRENKSPNGIVPTLKSFMGRDGKGAWVAWEQVDDAAERAAFERVIEIEDSYGAYRVSRLPLTSAQVKSFYHVTSKEAIWPILHGFKERYNYDPVDWPTFREVNWAFAEAAAAEVADDGVVWFHDYNLWLAPGYLRKLKPNVKIAFFHHTPFPSADMFSVLPWRQEIVESLLACDVVGFHIPRYAANFTHVAHALCAATLAAEAPTRADFSPQGMALSEMATPTRLSFKGRDVELSAWPVGVDVDYVGQVADDPETGRLLDEIRAELGDRKLILSVSRTDYTKGNVETLLAYERLFERRPDLIGKVRLMLVSVPANRNMAVYEAVQREIEELTGRINGRFGRLDWQPVSLISRAIAFKKLVAYHQAADVCWIAPLCDGLNLVAQEYVAARREGTGALVLSEFAGAAVPLAAAVMANPFSNRSMDAAIDQALDMPEAEQRARMKVLRERVRRYDMGAWTAEQRRLFAGLAAQETGAAA